MSMKQRLAGALAAALIAVTGPAAAEQFITIGTGGVTGVYYPAGGAICRLLNRGHKTHGIRCSVESTGGSVYNIESLRSGELDFGIAQSDWQYHAFTGTSLFEDKGPFDNLRAVFSVHPEPFTVVARAGSGIESFEDLKGKRVNIGNEGSGQRGTMEVLMKAMGWTNADFAEVSELKSADQSSALCDNKIDAIVYTVGHPSNSIEEATTSCESKLVNVDGPVVDALIADNSYYRKTTIPGGMYRGNAEDVTTFGVGATVITTSGMDEEVVYTLVKSVFENFDTFRKLHPAFANLSPEEMVSDGLSAPLHRGAVRYYKERGWIK
ncbi:TAXI family TRAP transporter solute-binding subunit [Roseibium sp. M-1]